MTYLENKIRKFKNMIGEFYYYGGLSYDDITIIGILYFKNQLSQSEITKSQIIDIVHSEINDLIDLD